jgi:hypothetical protein
MRRPDREGYGAAKQSMIKKNFGLILIIVVAGIANYSIYAGEMYKLVSDGRSVYTVLFDKSSDTLQELFPGKRHFLLPNKLSPRMYMEKSGNWLFILSYNKIFVFSEDLKLLKTLELPKSKSDYELRKITVSNNLLVATDSYKNAYLLRDSKLHRLKDAIKISNIEIKLDNSILFINGNKTRATFNSFFDLLHSVFILNDKYVFVAWNLYNNRGKKVSYLPIRLYVYDALPYANRFLIVSHGKIIILDEDGQVINERNANAPEILGPYKDRIIVKVGKHRFSSISAKTSQFNDFEPGKERIGSVVLVDNILFYVLSGNRSCLKKYEIRY